MMNFTLTGLTVGLMLMALSCQGDARPKTGTVASADGLAIHYKVEGAGEPTLVFVHGWSCDGSYWEPQCRHFAPRHRVVVLDLAGHGASETGREKWTMAAFAEDVRAVVATLGLTDVVLIGHSMSGGVIAEAALLMPDRVRGLVGIDNLQNPNLVLTEEQMDGFMKHFSSDFPRMTDNWVRTMFPPDADSALVGRVAHGMASAPPERALAILRQAFVWMVQDARMTLERLAVPLHCINSDATPTDTTAMAELVDGYRLHLMPDTGHFPHLVQPDVFNEELAAALAAFGVE